jgi:hypothetical protein
MNQDLTVTRYLYDKNKAFQTLEIAINDRFFDESMFWAYELYYSWYETEVIVFLLEVCKKRLPQYKRLYRFLSKKYAEWLEKPLSEKPAGIIGTIIKNILKNEISNEEPQAQIFIIMDESTAVPFHTLYLKHPYRILPAVCKYWLLEPPENPEILPEYKVNVLRDFIDNWLFYASRNPLWENRIVKHKGTINTEFKTVVFETHDLAEEFYAKYGYEPDEQSIEVQRRLIGI